MPPVLNCPTKPKTGRTQTAEVTGSKTTAFALRNAGNGPRHDDRLNCERVTGGVLEALSGGFASFGDVTAEVTKTAETPGVTDTRKGWF